MPTTNAPAPGSYRLYNARNTAVSLTVHYASCKNGANVQLSKNGDPEKNTSFADVWQLSYRADGTAQLINAYAGKSLDVAGGKAAPKTNVQIFTDNDSRAQAWDIVPSATGKVVTVGGTSYPTYYLQLHAAPEYVADAQGYDGAAKRNVQLFTRDADESATDQLWAFVPVAGMEDGGVYELVPVLNKKTAVDVASASKTDGASVQLAMRNDGNQQKWMLSKRADAEGEDAATWLLRAMHSGKCLNAYGGASKPHDGQRLVQWGTNGGPEVTWDVQRVGSAAMGGVKADVVSIRSTMTSKGEPYYVDSYDGLHGKNGWVKLKKPSSTTSQQWALIPTVPADGFVPVPGGIRLCPAVGSTETSTGMPVSQAQVPTWTCVSGWAPSGPNHYEVRMRKRDKAAVSGVWQEWDEWSSWEVAGVTVEDGRAWLTQGLPAAMSSWRLADGKVRLTEVELQVRCVVCDETGITHGPAADQSVYLYDAPTVTFGACGFAPDGIRLKYSSDWWAGSNTIRIDSIRGAATGEEMLAGPFVASGLDESGTILVPRERMTSSVPADGDSFAVVGGVGYDEWGGRDATAAPLSAEVTISYTSGIDLSPKVSATPDRTLRVSVPVPEGGSSHLWVWYDGTASEVGGTVAGGTATYELAYPFGKGFSLWVDSASADGDEWGIARVDVAANSVLFAGMRPCHAWTWDGGSFALELREGSPMELERTLTPTYESLALDSRPRETVFFGPTVKGQLSVEGAMLDTGEAAIGRLEAFAAAGHAFYRSPTGESFDVAITGVSYTSSASGYATVSVSMIEEAV
jgi:hypothetical protein|nr:MAG TPA: Ricin-type beta-trefoil lectin domain-like [Caudoviricetes sp.]